MRNVIITNVHMPTSEELEYAVLQPIVAAGLRLAGYSGTVDDFINDDKVANTYAVRMSSLLRTIPIATLEMYAIRKALFHGMKYASSGSITGLCAAALATYDIVNAAADLISKPSPGFMLKMRARKLIDIVRLDEGDISKSDDEVIVTTKGRWDISPAQLIALVTIAPFLDPVQMKIVGSILDGSQDTVYFEATQQKAGARIQKFSNAANEYVDELKRTSDAYATALLMTVGGIKRRSFGSIFMGIAAAIASKKT